MEIERKFLVLSDEYKSLGKPNFISQGYLCSDNKRTVRVRIKNEEAFLTIKSKTIGISREEFEYKIPLNEAKFILEKLCDKPIIEKNRYEIKFQNKIWEVDEFLGDNFGLILAEIELNSEDENFEKPNWVGEEVSKDPKYFNSNLAKNPYKNNF